VVSADVQGVISHAGVGLLRQMAEYTGLVEGVTDALIGTCNEIPRVDIAGQLSAGSAFKQPVGGRKSLRGVWEGPVVSNYRPFVLPLRLFAAALTAAVLAAIINEEWTMAAVLALVVALLLWLAARLV
jgi:hypothetical protein